MTPAHQRLGAAAFAAADVDDGLVVQLEFVAQQGPPHVLFEVAAVARLRLHGGLEEAIAVAAFRLRLVERKVGMADERIGVGRRRCGASVMPIEVPMTILRPSMS